MTEVVERTADDAASFVGRERELAVLLYAFEQARAGRGSLFLIGGEPGIGKSRLADEFAAHARESGARVLWGRGWEGAGAPAYWPWIQALRAHVRNADRDEVRTQLGSGAADVAQILPEIGLIVDDLPPAPSETESARFQLFDSTTSFLRNLSRAQPTVLILDDLQSADTSTILLLRFLASQLNDMHVVAIGTFRDVEVAPDHPLTQALTELAREPTTRVIHLAGLTHADVTRLVEVAAGYGPHGHLVARLWRETGGNPLFIAEAVRLLAAEGSLTEPSAAERLRLTLPAGIRDVITRRVRRLTEPSVRALICGAALGPDFSAEVVRRIGDYSGAALLDALDEATQAGLLMRAGLGRYRFSHDLVREALYAELTPAQRVRLHHRIAEALEELYGQSPDGHLAELAHHHFEAAQGEIALDAATETPQLHARAKRYATLAGEQAARSLAYEEAARLYERALQLLDAEHAPDVEERTDILLALGDAQARAGDLPSARPNFLEAARLARRSGAPQRLAYAALGYGGRFAWARAGDDHHMIPLLQEALVLLAGADDRLRVRLLSRLAGAWRGSSEHFEQSDALSQQAVEIARRLHDPGTLGYALVCRYGAIYWPHTSAERYGIAKEMLDVAQTAGDIERMIDGHMILSFTHADVGRMAEARAEMATLTRLADELRQPAQLWLANATRTSYALLEGDYLEAERLMEVESPAGYPTTPVRDDVSGARMHRFLLRREQARLGDEEATVRGAVTEFPWYPAHRAALVCLLLENERVTEATSAFAELARDRFAALIRDNEWLLAMALCSEACARLGDAQAAVTLYEQLLPYAGLHAIAHPEGSAGIVDRYLGLLAATLGRLDDADRHLADAISLNDRMGARPWRAHSQYDLATVLRRRGSSSDIHRAEQLELDALNTAQQLGMTALAARLTPATPGARGGAGEVSASRLTATFRREGEYWTIGFAGRSFRLHETKGLQYLARLLSEPGREFLALDLAREADVASAPGFGTDRADFGNDQQLDGASPGPALDEHAKSEYRTRLHELQEELDEAEAWGDAERAERARTEMDFLARELGRAVGLGGRDRVSGSATERARLSVTRAIRLVMKRISAHNRALGNHLEASIHTGTYCAYRPDPGLAVNWDVG